MILPEPLVPPDVDLRDFPYMPVDIVRLFGSQFHAQSNDATWRAGVTLWMKSYHQVPASSLPDDDPSLIRLSELGRDTRAWRKIREGALYRWEKCSDGRLYHRVVAEKALEAWIEKLTQRKSSGAGNASRWQVPFDPAALDQSITDCLNRLRALNPNSRTFAKRIPKASRSDPTGSPGGNAGGSPGGNPKSVPSGSQGKGSNSPTREIHTQEVSDRHRPPHLHARPGSDEFDGYLNGCNRE